MHESPPPRPTARRAAAASCSNLGGEFRRADHLHRTGPARPGDRDQPGRRGAGGPTRRCGSATSATGCSTVPSTRIWRRACIPSGGTTDAGRSDLRRRWGDRRIRLADQLSAGGGLIRRSPCDRRAPSTWWTGRGRRLPARRAVRGGLGLTFAPHNADLGRCRDRPPGCGPPEPPPGAPAVSSRGSATAEKLGQLAGEGVTRPGSESIGQVARPGGRGRSSGACREGDSIIKFGLTAHALHACNFNGDVRAERNESVTGRTSTPFAWGVAPARAGAQQGGK